MATPFKKLLVANRGEIAIRIFRAATELDLSTVAIYAWEDRLSLHRYKADEAWQIGGQGAPLGAYLDQEAILALALERGVDAIHPGYGFLSENAAFARACDEAGIVFIGPPADAIAALGDKVTARNLAVEAGVPVIPGTEAPLASVEEARTFAAGVGYPVMLKAAHGGGGRGMRQVFAEAELAEAYGAAEREALGAFGRGELFLEKLVQRPRHIEVQILGDRQGNLIHLFERDCSVQRRHQKVVEVAPAVGLDPTVREALYASALNIAKASGMANAATVEFLVDGEDPTRYYFIEVNPRLQVEHTITEMITGVDIVQSQIRLAEGRSLEELGLGDASKIGYRGAAIQARVTTEDPRNGFAPDTGHISAYRSAAGTGIRLDVGIAGAGAAITPYYDSLLVKVSAFALSHAEAARKLRRSLEEFRIRGVQTNIPFVDNILSHPQFLAGTIDTGFVERTKALFEFPRRRNRAERVLRALADTIVNGPPASEGPLTPPAVRVTPTLPPELPIGKRETYKALLDAQGPEAVARRVKEASRLLVTDTTFRDAHQSLIATRMRTYDMERVAAQTDQRLGAGGLEGAFSVECWGGATFDVAFRFLKENPWERLRRLRKRMPGTLLQMLLRGSNAVGYANYPENVVRRFVELAAREGIDVFRIFDCFNQLEAMKVSIDEVRKAGKIAEVCVCFTSDPFDSSRPLYDLDYYKRKAEEVTAAGAHIIAIKDMAGLARPRAARAVVEAIASVTDLPIHFHTHDTAGNGVASMLAAAEAGVDVIDGAIASMSGLTSQPSLNAIVAALQGSDRCPQLDLDHLQELSDYWEAVRTTYAPFESGLMASTTDIYAHEIPGGQYSNLKPQAFAVGLAEQWGEVRERYREVNFALGDLIKVTPSSKVVGDFALWLVKQELTVKELLESEQSYDFPESLIGFFDGAIGIPEGGFPDGLRRRVLGEACGPAPTQMRAARMEPYDYAAARKELERLYGGPIDDALEVSYALYPKVVRDYLAYRTDNADTSRLDSDTFFYGLAEGREILVDIEPGKSLIIFRTAVSELRPDGMRQVHFNLNGQPRATLVEDRSAGLDQARRPKVDPTDERQVGAPMPGNVVSVAAKVGVPVAEGDPLMVLEAMKLETTLRAPRAGTITELLVRAGERVDVADHVVTIE
ncbi:MAG: pyruvate carboxylase [Deltaproteobacteria bacterium]|nr:pyruvate carboxylase [Deltaproteobacteria bacterium]